jgi:hypothetical protein
MVSMSSRRNQTYLPLAGIPRRRFFPPPDITDAGCEVNIPMASGCRCNSSRILRSPTRFTALNSWIFPASARLNSASRRRSAASATRLIFGRASVLAWRHSHPHRGSRRSFSSHGLLFCDSVISCTICSLQSEKNEKKTIAGSRRWLSRFFWVVQTWLGICCFEGADAGLCPANLPH